MMDKMFVFYLFKMSDIIYVYIKEHIYCFRGKVLKFVHKWRNFVLIEDKQFYHITVKLGFIDTI